MIEEIDKELVERYRKAINIPEDEITDKQVIELCETTFLGAVFRLRLEWERIFKK